MTIASTSYPVNSAGRDKWILDRRPEREILDPWKPVAFSIEDECSITGEVVPVATVFLTNRECPWRCLMCDLWKHTLTEEAPTGAIPAQINHALQRLPPARQIKLYNSGSFFDPHAIPVRDYSEIARTVSSFERVIVESHPALLGEDCLRFRDLINGRLEVAIGLETVHPEILARLNKRMTLTQFSKAAEWLRRNEIDLRTFILVKTPFMDEPGALYWAQRSLDFAFENGATAASLIPTRVGNGALEALQALGQFSPPTMATLEASASYGLGLKRGRVFVDLWDLQRVASCQGCYPARAARFQAMNLCQAVQPSVRCNDCGAGS